MRSGLENEARKTSATNTQLQDVDFFEQKKKIVYFMLEFCAKMCSCLNA